MMALTMITTMMKRMMSLRRTTLMMTVIMTLMLTLVRIKMVTTAIMRTTTWRRTTMMMTAGGCGQPHSSVTAPLLFLPLGKLSSSISRQYISKLSSSISRQYISKLSSSISNCAILCLKCISTRSLVQCTRIKKTFGECEIWHRHTATRWMLHCFHYLEDSLFKEICNLAHIYKTVDRPALSSQYF